MSHVPHLRFFTMTKTNNILRISHFILLRYAWLRALCAHCDCAKCSLVFASSSFESIAIQWAQIEKITLKLSRVSLMQWLLRRSGLHHVHHNITKSSTSKLQFSNFSVVSFWIWLKSKRTDRMLCMKYFRKIELNSVAKFKCVSIWFFLWTCIGKNSISKCGNRLKYNKHTRLSDKHNKLLIYCLDTKFRILMQYKLYVRHKLCTQIKYKVQHLKMMPNLAMVCHRKANKFATAVAFKLDVTNVEIVARWILINKMFSK